MKMKIPKNYSAFIARQSTQDIVLTINALLQIFNERGESGAIVNWDDRSKKLGLIKTIGNSHYFMQENRRKH